MNAIYFLIPLTIILLIIAIGLFFWAVNNDQYSDLDKESHQILFDDDMLDEQQEKSETETVTKKDRR